MIVVLDDQLFSPDHAKDVALLRIIEEGARGRFTVRTRPAFRRDEKRPANEWIARQSDNAAETARHGLARGLRRQSHQWPPGRREPEVVLEVREQPSWPTSFDDTEARLPLDDGAIALLQHSLRLLLENGRSDWGFLNKTMPMSWRKRWRWLVKQRWIEAEHAGGITEMRQILDQEIAGDAVRRLRTWALFDSDAAAHGQPSAESQKTKGACERHGVPFHQLERRMIENYVSRPAMEQWAHKVRSAMLAADNKDKTRERARKLGESVSNHWELPPEQRHHRSLKSLEGSVKAAGFSGVADIWREDDNSSTGAPFDDGWDLERKALVLSLFASF